MTFEQYLTEGAGWLPGFTRVLCGRRDLAEDVLQEVLLRAHRHWARVAAADDPDAYLRRMVVNEFLRWRRRAYRDVPVATVVPTVTVPDHADAHAAAAQARELVAALPRRQRTAIVLRYFAGLSDAEIAAAMGCSEGAVRSYVSRALAAMRIDVPDDDFAGTGLTRTGKDGRS